MPLHHHVGPKTLSFSELIWYLKGAAYVDGTFILSLLVKHVHKHRDTGL